MAHNSTDNKDAVDFRILVVGDSGVGKSSLISALVHDEFREKVPARFEHIIIPPDVTPERMVSAVYDYSSRVQSVKDLDEDLRNCDVIVLIYSVLDEETEKRITSYWLPKFHEILGSDNEIPVILVGNKSDVPDSDHLSRILPIMNEHVEIETCVESSAKTLKNVSEIFFYAQKAVIYPIRPLYNAEDKELTVKSRKALVHIFKLSDLDNDGLLNDMELNEFQILCFDYPLTDNAIEEVKRVIKTINPKSILDECITLDGFLCLQQLFIQRGRHETTWIILKRFGFDHNLQLRHKYLYPRIEIPPGSSVEFSKDGFNFLLGLFRKFDEDHDNCLSIADLTSLFSVCPSCPWTAEQLNSVETTSVGWLTLGGYISLWAMSAFLSVTKTMELLAYLGYNLRNRSQLSAFVINRDRRIDIQEKKTYRRVFQCHVIGPKDVGKTVFCRSFVGKTLLEIQCMNRREMTPFVINSVQVKDEDKFLLLREVDIHSPSDILTPYELSADVICLLYDGTDGESFNQCAQIYLRNFHRTKVPVVFVVTKVTGDFEVEQNFEVTPNEFCRVNNLPPPVRFSTSDIGRPDAAVYTMLASMAVYPHLKHVYYIFGTKTTTVSFLTFGAGMALLAGFLIYKNVK